MSDGWAALASVAVAVVCIGAMSLIYLRSASAGRRARLDLERGRPEPRP